VLALDGVEVLSDYEIYKKKLTQRRRKARSSLRREPNHGGGGGEVNYLSEKGKENGTRRANGQHSG